MYSEESSFEFIKNDICNFEVLSKIHLLKPKVNIITSVFFKREQYYKNYAIYTKGLDRVLKFVDDKRYNDLAKGGFVYVLFIDTHVANDSVIRAKIDACRNCVPVLFGCSEYIVNDYHVDLFGTLVRFFPLFNFEKNPCDIVICIDIDLHGEDYIRLKNLMKYKHKGITAAGDIARYFYMGINPYIYAGLMCFNQKKLDHDIIMNFIKNADKIESKGNYGKRDTTYGYGIDEIFLNEYLLPKIGNVNIIIDYQISYFLFHSKPHLIESDRIDKTSEILSIILGEYDPNDNTNVSTHTNTNISSKTKVEKQFEIIDKATYQIHERTPENDEISRRFTGVIEHLVDNKNVWIEKKVLMFIHKYLLHIISANLIINYNYKKGVTGTKVYDVIYDTDSENAVI